MHKMLVPETFNKTLNRGIQSPHISIIHFHLYRVDKNESAFLPVSYTLEVI